MRDKRGNSDYTSAPPHHLEKIYGVFLGGGCFELPQPSRMAGTLQSAVNCFGDPRDNCTRTQMSKILNSLLVIKSSNQLLHCRALCFLVCLPIKAVLCGGVSKQGCSWWGAGKSSVRSPAPAFQWFLKACVSKERVLGDGRTGMYKRSTFWKVVS